MAEPYESSLNRKFVLKAKKELHEDPKERHGAVTALREWMEREPWINTPTDPKFLLSFLRCGKFSQLKARERLWRFMNGFNYIFSGLKNKDPADDDMLKILRETKFFMVLPDTDSQGRRVFLCRLGRLDTSGKNDTFAAAIDAAMMLFHSLMFLDEDFQVNGAVMLMDFANCHDMYGMARVKAQAESTGRALPVRIKGIHCVNTGSVSDTTIKSFNMLLTKKLQGRIKIHGSKLTSVFKEIDMSLLPDDYLPDDYEGPSAGSADVIIEQNIDMYLLEPSRRAFLQDLYSCIHFVDIGKKTKTDEEPQASFRKLQVS